MHLKDRSLAGSAIQEMKLEKVNLSPTAGNARHRLPSQLTHRDFNQLSIKRYFDN